MICVAGRMSGPAGRAVNTPADHFTAALEGATMRDESTHTADEKQAEVIAVQYRDIPDFPGYRAGSDGSVWSRRRRGSGGGFDVTWRRLSGVAASNGYVFVELTRGGKGSKQLVHRLVLQAFVGLCPPGMEACHYPDRNRTNNALSNLRWDTKYANASDAHKHGTVAQGERNGNSKLTAEDVVSLRDQARRGIPKRVLAAQFRIARRTVSDIVNRKIWRYVP